MTPVIYLLSSRGMKVVEFQGVALTFLPFPPSNHPVYNILSFLCWFNSEGKPPAPLLLCPLPCVEQDLASHCLPPCLSSSASGIGLMVLTC